MNTTTNDTLFEQIGGTAAIEAAVEIFYTKVMADVRINHFFRWTNMTSQVAKQRAFLTMAFGGPTHYNGKGLRRAHAHLVKVGLNDSHFEAVLEHLVSTLKELQVPEALITQAGRIADSSRKDVLGQ